MKKIIRFVLLSFSLRKINFTKAASGYQLANKPEIQHVGPPITILEGLM